MSRSDDEPELETGAQVSPFEEVEAEESEAEESRWAELDLRSLAIFRITLGLFVLFTLGSSLGDWTAFFTDAGVLPREFLVSSPFGGAWLSFHLGSGGLAAQVVLNTVLAAFAVGLILGWRTPWMVLGCWVLLNSLQVRNPFICDRGDLELVLMLFWGFFLPLGACWSLDARAQRPSFGSAHGLAPAGLVLQFVQIYFFAALLKSGPFWLVRGDGLKYSLISSLFGTDLSFSLAGMPPSLLYVGNYLAIALEFFIALLLLNPWMVAWTRTLAVALLVGFHLSIAVIFDLGLFPWIGALLPLSLLPKEFWSEWALPLTQKLDRLLGSQTDDPTPERSQAWLIWLRKAAVALCIGLVLVANLAYRLEDSAFELPRPIVRLTEALRLSQHWELFSPLPPFNGSFQVVVTNPSGKSVDVFSGPPTMDRPDLEDFPSHRWRMLMIASLFAPFDLVRPGLVRGLASRAGIEDLKGQRVDYTFHVRQVDRNGKLLPPLDWALWRSDDSH